MRLRRHKANGESYDALREAEQHLEDVKSKNPEVYSTAGQLRRIRERNHFAEQIYIIMTGEREGRHP